MRVEAEVRFRNGAVREALAARGWSQADLARKIGADQQNVGRIVNMRLAQFSWEKKIGHVAMLIAAELGLDPDEVVPPEAAGTDTEPVKAIGEVGLAQLERMSGVYMLPEHGSAESVEMRLDAQGQVADVLGMLPERDAAVLRARFGIGEAEKSLSECGKRFRISREHVRQIEAKAIRRARHKLRSKLADMVCDGYVQVESAPAVDGWGREDQE